MSNLRNEYSVSSSSMESSDNYISSSSDENYENENNLELEGDIIGKYNVITELGRGSYSIVWLVYDIESTNFFALKVQNPEDYREGLDEIKMLKKLPTNVKVFNHLIDHFIHQVPISKKKRKKKKKFVCSVFELHCGNLDHFIRKGKFKDGLGLSKSKIIFKQLMEGLNILHHKLNVFHGDIKPDNILLKGLNKRDEKLIELYRNKNFNNIFESKIETWLTKKNIKKENIKKKDINKIRKIVHNHITNQILDNFFENFDESDKYLIDDKYIENPEICIADFGDFCSNEEKYDEEFGTRYYRAPEIILLSECDSKVDVWAAGCTLYEMLTGKILFDPKKDKHRSRDFYHLLAINKYRGRFPKRFLKNTKYWKKFFNKNYLNVILK